MSTQPGGSDTSDKKLIAAVLALLIGGLGAHRFYVGHVKLGVVYLCLFWTGVPELLGLVEGILILVKDDAWFHENYLAEGSEPIFG